MAMPDFDTTTSGREQQEAAASADEREHVRQRVWEFLVYLFKRFILFVSFGTGVLGFMWLLGRIFKR